jgi:phytoene/squalene synthetase
MHKYSLPPEMLEEIIAGVEMDLSILRYSTFEELRVYCYRVASAVGLVSIKFSAIEIRAAENTRSILGSPCK